MGAAVKDKQCQSNREAAPAKGRSSASLREKQCQSKAGECQSKAGAVPVKGRSSASQRATHYLFNKIAAG
jgi:hypothetical protein